MSVPSDCPRVIVVDTSALMAIVMNEASADFL